MIANNSSIAAVRTLVIKYWFQLCLSGLAIFIFLRKDLSFSVSFRAPIDAQVLPAKNAGNLAKAENATKNAPQSSSQNAGQNAGQSVGQSVGQNTSTQNTDDNTVLKAEVKSEQQASIFSWGGKKNDKKGGQADAARENSDGSSAAAKQNFVGRFLNIAQTESKKFRIPVSIILAQGILQTQAGENPLAETGNNFFKLRATADWHGKTYHAKTGVYRAYPTAWSGFRDHSEFITSGSFKNLRFIDSKNYAAWAAGLQAGGFSKEKDYAKRLISIIENEGLSQYDK